MCSVFPKTVPISFWPFLLRGLWGCREQSHPRLCLKATWTFIVCPRLYPTSARALSPKVNWARVTISLAPHIYIYIYILFYKPNHSTNTYRHSPIKFIQLFFFSSKSWYNYFHHTSTWNTNMEKLSLPHPLNPYSRLKMVGDYSWRLCDHTFFFFLLRICLSLKN